MNRLVPSAGFAHTQVKDEERQVYTTSMHAKQVGVPGQAGARPNS